MSQRTNRRAIVLAAAAVVSAAGWAQAGTTTWIGAGNGGTGTSWNDGANWSGGTVPGAADSAVYRAIAGTPATTLSLDASQTVGDLQFPTYGNQPELTIGSADDVTAGYTLAYGSVFRGDNVGNYQTMRANVALTGNVLYALRQGYNGGVAHSGAISGTDLTLTKDANGTLEFWGAQAFTGNIVANQGTVRVDFSRGTAPATSMLGQNVSLTLSGATFALKGKSKVSRAEALGSVSLARGGSSFTIDDPWDGSVVIDLGAISRDVGGTVNFAQGRYGTSATKGYKSSVANDASGIVGAYATTGDYNTAGTDWVTNNGTNLAKYSAYTVDTWGAGINTDVAADGTIAAGSETHTLRFAQAAARTMTLAGDATLTSGGILVAPGVGANPTTITGGTLKSGAADLVIHQNNSNATGAMTIASAIADGASGATALTKAGGGTLNLTGALSYTGGTYVNGGTLNLVAGSTNPMSQTGDIVVTGGTLALGAGTAQTTSGEVAIRGGTISGGTLTKTGSDYDGQSGTVTSILSGSVGMTKSGGGVLTLSANNSYTGETKVLAGELAVTADGGLDGNITVGSAAGGPLAMLRGTNGNSFHNSRSVTVYRNGSASFANNEDIGNLVIVGGYATGSYLSTDSIFMTGGQLDGGAIYNPWASQITTYASSETARITATLDFGGYNYKTITVADGAADVDLLITKPIIGTAGGQNFTKTGAGVMKLDGANTYTAPTVINGGTFWVGSAGSVNTTSKITVNNNGIFRYDGATALTVIPTLNNTAQFIYNSPVKLGVDIAIASGRTLGGSGVLGNVTVDGLLSPGNSPGVLTVDSLVLGSGATTTMEIAGDVLGSGYDNVSVVNAAGLTYGGTLDVIALDGYAIAGDYNLFTFTGGYAGEFSAVTVNGFALTNAGGVWSGTQGEAIYSFNDSTGVLTAAVPEPGTIGLAACVMGLGLMRRQRKA